MPVKKVLLFILILLSFVFVAFRRYDSVFLNIEGYVTIDGKPVKAEIEINSISHHNAFKVKTGTKEAEGLFYTKLPAEDEYEIIVRVDRFPQQVLTLNTLHLDSNKALNVFADFTSPAYDKKLEELLKSTLEKSGVKLMNFDLKNFSGHYGDRIKESLEYKIQVAAYKFYENFNYNNVLGFPKIIRKTYPDQITRFTMGSFQTYNQAFVLLEEVKKKNLNDAFIVAIYKGEKKLLSQLLEEKIIH